MTGLRLGRALGDVAAALEASGVPWCLVGGLGVSARAEPRFTRDLDLAVSVADDEAAEALVRDLMARHYQAIAVVEHDTVDRLAMVRLVPPGERSEGVVVDLLFASSGIEPELTAQSERMEVLGGVVVPVAALGHLLALKLLARDDERRPQDAVDLRALLAVADDRERARALEAVWTIQARGFARGRDLVSLLSDLVGSPVPSRLEGPPDGGAP